MNADFMIMDDVKSRNSIIIYDVIGRRYHCYCQYIHMKLHCYLYSDNGYAIAHAGTICQNKSYPTTGLAEIKQPKK